MVVAFYLPFPGHNIAAAVVFVLAAVTDWLDGYLARRMNLTSAFGAFLDPVADKLMVAVTLFLLVESHHRVCSHYASCERLVGMVMAVTAAIIVGREISVSALREWMAEIGMRAAVKVAFVGKLKTVMQMVALVVLIVQHEKETLAPVSHRRGAAGGRRRADHLVGPVLPARGVAGAARRHARSRAGDRTDRRFADMDTGLTIRDQPY